MCEGVCTLGRPGKGLWAMTWLRKKRPGHSWDVERAAGGRGGGGHQLRCAGIGVPVLVCKVHPWGTAEVQPSYQLGPFSLSSHQVPGLDMSYWSLKREQGRGPFPGDPEIKAPPTSSHLTPCSGEVVEGQSCLWEQGGCLSPVGTLG